MFSCEKKSENYAASFAAHINDGTRHVEMITLARSFRNSIPVAGRYRTALPEKRKVPFSAPRACRLTCLHVAGASLSSRVQAN